MEAPAERLAYGVLLSPDRLKPDALTVAGVDRRSANFGKTVDRLDMLSRGDEFHHFGWNSHHLAHRPENFFARRNNSPAIGVSLTSGASRATGERAALGCRFNRRRFTTWRACATVLAMAVGLIALATHALAEVIVTPDDHTGERKTGRDAVADH